MILSCSFEELRALASGAELVLAMEEARTGSGVAAPAESRARLAMLQRRDVSPIRVETLAEQRLLREALGLICDRLHDRLEETVLEYHPAHEDAVNLYFDYAHAFGVLNRVDEMGAEMHAMIEVMTGGAPTEAEARSISFPD